MNANSKGLYMQKDYMNQQYYNRRPQWNKTFRDICWKK